MAFTIKNFKNLNIF